MARIFDVIEYPNEMRNELVHRFPESGSGDFRIGSQVIVRESQAAVFFRDGKALDVFGPGRHTITTANIPLLVNIIGLAFSGRTPFKAEVYFVNMRDFIDMKWGTPEPITLRDKELGMARLRANGRYSMAVADPQMFVAKIVGTQGLYTTNQIEDYLRGIIISRLTDILPALGTSPEEKEIREMIWDVIEETLDELPEEQRYAFAANGFEEMSFGEMSRRTGTPVNTLISRKRYAVLALRKNLSELYKLLKNE